LIVFNFFSPLRRHPSRRLKTFASAWPPTLSSTWRTSSKYTEKQTKIKLSVGGPGAGSLALVYISCTFSVFFLPCFFNLASSSSFSLLASSFSSILFVLLQSYFFLSSLLASSSSSSSLLASSSSFFFYFYYKNSNNSHFVLLTSCALTSQSFNVNVCAQKKRK
jgi:hypothetical protein